jgi:riboflavin transporter FmnP
MKTKTLALTIVFAALTIALNPTFTKIAFAAPFATFLFYQIWEIPIVAALILVGFKAAASISVINTAVLLAVFPGASPTGPFYNLAAALSMMVGIYIAHRLVSRLKTESPLEHGTLVITSATALGILFRVGVMTLVNYALLRYPQPLGYGYDELGILASLPLIGFFNATLALYTIPIAYIIANVIKKNLKL